MHLCTTLAQVILQRLHGNGFWRQDLKASNVLVKLRGDLIIINVTDYQCLVSIVVTGFGELSKSCERCKIKAHEM